MSVRFVHLHLHTEYSILDSVVRVKNLMEQVVQANMPAVAMTDQCNLFAMVKFYRAAMQHGLKPIIGSDIWLTTEGRDLDRMILLCRDHQGYRNLSRLLTRAYLDGQKRSTPAIERAWLSRDSVAGLMALSGGREGGLGRHLLAGRKAPARHMLDDLMELFGGDFFIELQRTGRAREEDYIQMAVELASLTDCPVVATNDVRFLRQQDFEAHEARVCIQQGRVLNDSDRPREYSDQQYLRTAEEMQALFTDLPEALENSVEIARRCNLELSLGEPHLPAYDVPDGLTTDKFLAAQASEGLRTRLDLNANTEVPATYAERLKTELDVIRGMGFPGYFLIVADFIRWAKANDIPVGPGRGSGAGSLVAYVLGITELDPIEHDLLFERFLNPERVSMPDFDIDFCMDGRDRVIDYVSERYGRDRVSQIITYGTMAAKAVVRDVARILGHPYGFADRVAKLIPFELGMTLDKAVSQEQELKDLYAHDDEVRATIDLARQLEGLVRNAGRHAGGVVIAPTEITAFTPLFRMEGETVTITQFDKDDVEAAGLVKFDFLGLRTLTIIDRAVKTINLECRSDAEGPIDIRTINMDDPKVFKLLQACRTTAIFQLESRGMRDLVKRLRPDHFDDIVALVALYRPGPLQSGMVDDFISRKHAGKGQAIDYFHPDLEAVLRSTYGVILYQEQVMQIAQRLSDYTLGEADILRRAMGKKKPEEMAKQRFGFIDGAEKRGVKRAVASRIFDLVEKFAGYGFNKSHSAAYAVLTYQTAWLKAHYPAAFMAAVLSSEMDDTDKLVIFKRDCDAHGLQLLPPDVNDSGYAFSRRGEAAVRYGLGAIKGLGRNAAEQILAVRQAGEFSNLDDFCQRMSTQKVGRRAIEALIKSGAMDQFAPNRPSLLAILPTALNRAEQNARALAAGQEDMFSLEVNPSPDDDVIPAQPDWSFSQMLEAERESLGLYMSGHPFDQYRTDAPFITSGSIARLIAAPVSKKADKRWSKGREIMIAGLVTGLRRRGGRVTLDLDDGEGRIEVTLFQETFEQYRHLLTAHAIVVISGALKFDEFIDAWRVTATEVLDIDRVIEARALKLVIRWQEDVNGKLNARRLKQVLEPFRPGACDVSVFYLRNDAQARVRFGADWSVRPSRDLRDQLAEIVGWDGFRFLYETSASARNH
ncbi:MAG: DNA polymerase III subunit alpha [Gammaproteobacteria bacterium]|nr:DNA polymerase III subunit alpha [Gammaproteobacteria bacterium]